ncbi:hypothetical protein RN001_009506 [Aquatica leii]|uniref:Uncharacterized protein n=1 Tax=Aquatica leii TaxID=1421715 RepID=A0AAN7NZP5_9COLE|nr:hypothetical protein RN001_009506 [Aquatica leii]
MSDDKTSVEVILGTYEEFLLGYRCFPKNNDIEQTFATHSHSSSIRTVCTSGKYLASGGADDRIFIYDLELRKEQCVLTHHKATLNAVAFTPEHTHLISGSNDGVLAIVRVGNWQLEKIWDKAHKGAAILDIAVHFSGKLALSLGSDHCLCTWNLVKGRQAYVINLNNKSKDPKSLDRISWAPCGVRFVLSGGKYTEIWSIEKGGILKAIEHSHKVICCTWISNNTLLVGYENGKMGKVNSYTGEIEKHHGHTSRVKCMSTYNKFIITGASQGDVKIWDEDLKMLLESSSGCRITCLCVTDMVLQDPVSRDDGENEAVEELAPASKVTRRGVVTEEHDSDSEVIPQKKIKRKSKRKKHKN